MPPPTTTNPQRSWVVYTLHDPRNPEEIRYVGKTHQNPPRLRLKHHLGDARGTVCQTHCIRWVRQVLKDGVRPVMTIIENGVGKGWVEAEIKWIKFYRDQGMPLTNLTDGGDGTLGYRVTDEEIEIRRKRMAALWATSKDTMCKAIREGNNNPETKALRHEASLQRQSNPETQAKQAEAQVQSWKDPDIRARRTSGNKKAQANPTLRKQHSDRVKNMWADPEAKEKRRISLRMGWAKRRAALAKEA